MCSSDLRPRRQLWMGNGRRAKHLLSSILQGNHVFEQSKVYSVEDKKLCLISLNHPMWKIPRKIQPLRKWVGTTSDLQHSSFPNKMKLAPSSDPPDLFICGGLHSRRAEERRRRRVREQEDDAADRAAEAHQKRMRLLDGAASPSGMTTHQTTLHDVSLHP